MGLEIPLDFTGVEQRGSVRVPEGDYVLKVKKVERKKAQSSGNPMLVVTFEFTTGKFKGKTIIDRHILVKDSLWTLRNMMEAMGWKVPPRKMKLNVDKMLIGRKVGATIVDGEEYKKRIKSEVADYLPVDAVGNRSDGDMDSSDDDEDDIEDDIEDELEDELDVDEEDEDEDDEEETSDEEDDDDFSFDDDDDDDDDDEEDESDSFSFDASDVEEAKGPQLKEYVKEAQDAGWDLDLGKSAKVAEVREALLALFEDEDDEDEEDDEEFSLDDA